LQQQPYRRLQRPPLISWPPLARYVAIYLLVLVAATSSDAADEICTHNIISQSINGQLSFAERRAQHVALAGPPVPPPSMADFYKQILCWNYFSLGSEPQVCVSLRERSNYVYFHSSSYVPPIARAHDSSTRVLVARSVSTDLCTARIRGAASPNHRKQGVCHATLLLQSDARQA